MLDFMQVRTYWCALSWRSHFSFERVLAVQLDRVGGFAWVNRQVDQVGVVGLLVVGGPPSVLLGPPALPRRAVPVLEELVVVELVAAGAGVALVLGDGVGHALVHVDVHLGAEHRHVVAWGEEGRGCRAPVRLVVHPWQAECRAQLLDRLRPITRLWVNHQTY